MAKKAAAQNGRADLPVSQDAQQCVCDWYASHHVKVMLIKGQPIYEPTKLF
jgi:hypothetical protein